ncbi:MAG TPA: hypothetical protein VLS46_00600 [Gaiellaceae bacterium]|nr:hypothetical protein [Gaiellaceae bacterium]
MATPPQHLTLKEHRDGGHVVELRLRHALMALFGLLALLALVNVFGQHPVSTAASGGRATLAVSAPTSLRGGLFYMGRFTITAAEEIESATIVLDKGWLESMHINTIEPAPVGEASRAGELALDFGHVPAGETITAYLEFQVNPTNVGRRSQRVRLFDGERLLTEADRTVTVFP